MGVEQKLVEYICQTVFDDLPKKAVNTVKKLVKECFLTLLKRKEFIEKKLLLFGVLNVQLH